jgi:hypothetical protein
MNSRARPLNRAGSYLMTNDAEVGRTALAKTMSTLIFAVYPLRTDAGAQVVEAQ